MGLAGASADFGRAQHERAGGDITGSSSGGLSIAFRTLGADYLRMIEAAGISPDLFPPGRYRCCRRPGHPALPGRGDLTGNL